MKTICFFVGIFFFIGCTKNFDQAGGTVVKEIETNHGQYLTFTIQKGAHYCDQNPVKSITISEMKFMVKFDSSAIYQT